MSFGPAVFLPPQDDRSGGSRARTASRRLRLSGQSLSWRAFDMIWHQMRARSAIAAAFFTIALLRYRKTVVQTA